MKLAQMQLGCRNIRQVGRMNTMALHSFANCVLILWQMFSSSMLNQWLRNLTKKRKVSKCSLTYGTNSCLFCWIMRTRRSHCWLRIQKCIQVCNRYSSRFKTISREWWSFCSVRNCSWRKYQKIRVKTSMSWFVPKCNSTTRRSRHLASFGKKCR